jgi:hypothetical protein
VSRATNVSTARFVCSMLTLRMCMSSKTIAKVRRVGGPATFVATRETDVTDAVVCGDTMAGSAASTGSKAVIVCGRPSSFTTKSARVRPGTGFPSRSSTTASTVTISACAGDWGGVWPDQPRLEGAGREAEEGAE